MKYFTLYSILFWNFDFIIIAFIPETKEENGMEENEQNV